MHDQSLEQKLRVALQEESDRQPFTITAAELERRLALRRRGGMTPLASLGLAAAVGIGLLGLAGIAGGWFETRTAVVLPSPSPVAVASVTPSAPTSASPAAGPRLPSLDDLLAPHDPATIVRAQAVGPADGPPSTAQPVPWSVGFAAFPGGGSYVVDVACLGSDDLRVTVVEAGVDGPGRSVPFGCDGGTSSRFVELAAGESIAVASSRPASWRIAIRGAARPTPHAESVADITVSDEDATLLDVRSPSDVPDYGPAGTGGGLWLPADVGWVTHRDQYRVLVSCAGPHAIRYAFAQPVDQTKPKEAFETYSDTEVECDGGIHEDVLDLPLDEARFVVTSSNQIAWRVVVEGDPLPIALAPDGDGWTTLGSAGPNFFPRGQRDGLTVPTTVGGDVRIVVSCAGDGIIDGTIDVGDPLVRPTDPYTLDCNVEHTNAITLERAYRQGGSSATVKFDPHGTPVWVAITIQIRDPANPAP